ncbi:MAG: hypothetical protein AAFN93_15710 [Bacteroidota bacterium]
MINYVSSEIQYSTTISDTFYAEGYVICNGKHYDNRSSKPVSKALKTGHLTDNIMDEVIANLFIALLGILRA